MKTILVLTDFTLQAARAAEAALYLGEKLQKDILLYHSTVWTPVVPNFAPGPWVYDESNALFVENQEKLESVSAHLKTLQADFAPGAYRPQITIRNGEGDLGENTRALLGAENVDFIVMGGRSGGTIDHLLNGSDTAAVIKYTNRPVLVMPKKQSLKKIKKIVFATDFKTEDIAAIAYLSTLGAKLGFALDVIHVRLTGDTDVRRFQQEKTFIDFLNKLEYPGLIYDMVHGMNVVNRLLRYCEEAEADVLALIHEQPGAVTSWFRHSDTKEALLKTSLPLFIFPQHLLD